MEIEILNWKRFNGRNDVRNPSWFRVDYRMMEDPDFYSFSHEEFRAWLYLMAQACRKNSGIVTINYQHARATSRLSKKAIDSTVCKLEKLTLITRNVDVTPTLRERDATVQYSTGQYILPNSELSSEIGHPELEEVSQVLATRGITRAQQDLWLQAFPDARWLSGEIKKARAWEEANRRKKNFARFMTNWLSTGWDKRRDKSDNRKKISTEELERMIGDASG